MVAVPSGKSWFMSEHGNRLAGTAYMETIQNRKQRERETRPSKSAMGEGGDAEPSPARPKFYQALLAPRVGKKLNNLVFFRRACKVTRPNEKKST